MPTVPVYLDDATYFKVVMEAEKIGWKAGKFISEVVKTYIRAQEERRETDAREEI